MKKFIVKIFIFGISLIVSAFIVDYVITSGLEKTGDKGAGGYEEFTTWNAIFSSSVNTDLIINGSSRGNRHISPLVLDTMLNINSYNIGMTGASLNKQYIRYMTLEKYNQRPKYIIQDVDYLTLTIKNDLDDRFLPYLKKIDKSLIDNNLKWVKNYQLKIPAIKYFSQKELIIQGFNEFFNIKHYHEAREKGFFGTDMQWDGSAFRKLLQAGSLVTEIQEEAIILLDSYLKHCKENDIQVILVFSPVYYEATEHYNDLNVVIDVCNSLSKKYDFHFLDYLNDPICYDTIYFYNATHLNKTGAELFSAKLANDIDSLGILK